MKHCAIPGCRNNLDTVIFRSRRRHRLRANPIGFARLAMWSIDKRLRTSPNESQPSGSQNHARNHKDEAKR